jgi:uncharacterized protein YfbU (UPF0304 family)
VSLRRFDVSNQLKYRHFLKPTVEDRLKSVQAIAAKSGVEFRLHDLRRTFASIVNHSSSAA